MSYGAGAAAEVLVDTTAAAAVDTALKFPADEANAAVAFVATAPATAVAFPAATAGLPAVKVAVELPEADVAVALP